MTRRMRWAIVFGLVLTTFVYVGKLAAHVAPGLVRSTVRAFAIVSSMLVVLVIAAVLTTLIVRRAMRKPLPAAERLTFPPHLVPALDHERQRQP